MGDTRYSRQSFLGEGSSETLKKAVVGVVGLGGGGSHIVQQLAHLGLQNFVLYDHDAVDCSNLNRLVGATEQDANDGVLKIDVAKRVIGGLQPQATVDAHACRWQEKPEPLRLCDIVVGCVDSFSERGEIEICARRYMMPYVDIGMDVIQVAGEAPRAAGQVIMSMPGGPCMRCISFLTDQRLAEEASRYGDAGPRPQVVWPNGVLASTAVGLVIDLLTGWSGHDYKVVYLSYDVNRGTISPHVRLGYLEEIECPHHPASQVGDPVLSSV